MKHVLKLGGGMFLMSMLLFFSCSMGIDSDVDDGSSSSSDITGITLGVNTFDTARTILPEDWTDDLAGALKYVLEGKKSGDTDFSVLKTFDYSELSGKTAKVNLELTSWDLKLTGYLTKTESGTAVVDTTKPCLQATKSVDLSSGSTRAIVFDLKPYTETTDATGSFDVTIAWFGTAAKRVEFGVYDKDTASAAIIADTGRDAAVVKIGTTKFNSIATDTAFASSSTTTKKKSYGDSGLKAGEYKFAAVFYDATTGGSVNGYYIDYMYIDGGNVSKATINFGNKFGDIPDNPTWLSVKTKFAPQKLDASGTAAGTYLAEFHWNDVAVNETGYELVITEYKANGTDIEATTRIFDTVPTGVTDANAKTLADSGLNASELLDGTTVTTGATGNNKLDAGKTSVVLQLKTGTLYNAKIRAINTFNEKLTGDDLIYCTNLNGNGDGKGTQYAPVVVTGTGDTALKQFGLFSVTYDLDDGSVKESESAALTSATTVKKYALGYNYSGEEQELLDSNTLKYPYIERDGYLFGYWNSTAATPAEVPTISAKNIENLTLKAKWVGSDVAVSVTFPSYAGAKDVKLVAGRTEDSIIGPVKPSESVTVNAGASLSDVTFTLTAPNTGVQKDTSADSTWTWTVPAGADAGYYCLTVSGTYKDSGSNRDLTLTGNVYILVQNN